MIDISNPDIEFVISPTEPTVVNIIDSVRILCRINVTDQAKGRLLIDSIANAIRARRWLND